MPDPGWRLVAILRHSGHGPTHLDIVLQGGSLCPTLRVEGRRWRWQPPHRRRYLGWSGAVSGGRGRILLMARGQARLVQHNLGWHLQIGFSSVILRRDGVVISPGASHSRPWALMTPA